jgi:hypothetical protein
MASRGAGCVADKYLEHNRRHIETFLDNWDRINRSAAGSEVPAGKESKGMRQYSSPISNAGFNYIDDPGNREASDHLERILPRMRREHWDWYYNVGMVAGWFAPQHRPAPEQEKTRLQTMHDEIEEARKKTAKKHGKEPLGRPEPAFANAARTLAHLKRMITGHEARESKRRLNRQLGVPSFEETDHGILRRWQAGQTEDDRNAHATFLAATGWIAQQLPEGTVLDVYAPGGRSAKTPRQAAAMDREERQREQHAAANRIRYSKFLFTRMQYPDANRSAAKALTCEKWGWGMKTVENAIRFCEQNEWHTGEIVEPRFRWSNNEGKDAM